MWKRRREEKLVAVQMKRCLVNEEREKDLSIRDSSRINLIAKRGEFNNRVSSFDFKRYVH